MPTIMHLTQGVNARGLGKSKTNAKHLVLLMTKELFYFGFKSIYNIHIFLKIKRKYSFSDINPLQLT